MKKLGIVTTIISGFIGIFSMSTVAQDEPFEIDARSAHIGAIGAFAEMVRLDVKRLALGSPVSPAEMEKVLPHAQKVIEHNGVEYFLETDFLVTDLYPAAVTDGKHVLFIYKGETIQEYLALKKEQSDLIEKGTYDKTARLKIAHAFGKLLSYPKKTISNLVISNAN
ncbi:MAG: hypothetical protein AB3N28_11565 [Kordiimonas sp.]